MSLRSSGLRAAGIALACGALALACRGRPSATSGRADARVVPTDAARTASSDATVVADAGDGGVGDGAQGAAFGPPNPWGDGAIPDSSARGPEADATRSRMTALRASIGFWRIDRDARAYCPTLEDLARTPAAVFNRETMGRDAWGTPLEIDCQGARVRVRSLGPDRVRETPDDMITP